jgi:hypothetical protein
VLKLLVIICESTTPLLELLAAAMLDDVPVEGVAVAVVDFQSHLDAAQLGWGEADVKLFTAGERPTGDQDRHAGERHRRLQLDLALRGGRGGRSAGRG